MPEKESLLLYRPKQENLKFWGLLHAKMALILGGKQTGVFFEHLPEMAAAVVTQLVADFIKCALVILQQPFGGFHTGALQISQRRIAGGLFESAFEGATAHAVMAGHKIEIDGLRIILLEPLLCALNRCIGVIFLEFEHRVGGLGCSAHIVDQRL